MQPSKPRNVCSWLLRLKVGFLPVIAVFCVYALAFGTWRRGLSIKSPLETASLLNLSAALPSITKFALPYSVWSVQTATSPPFQLAVYRYPDGRWEPLANSIVKLGFYEPAETHLMEQMLSELCQTNGLVVDVGGFVGYYTILASSKGCRVHVWEAHPQNAAMLDITVLLNGQQDSVVVHHNVCTDGKEPVRFTGHFMDGHVSSSYEKTDNDLRKAELEKEGRLKGAEEGSKVWPLAISDAISEDVQLMKVDVEGYEPFVFASAKPLLEARKVKYVMFEFNMWRAMTKKEGVDLVMQLLSWKYQVFNTPTQGCGLLEYTRREQVELMASQLQNKTYPCGEYAINMIAARDRLPVLVLNNRRIEAAPF